MKGKKTLLIILDGWGHGDKSQADVIYNSSTPFIDSLYSNSPNCELLTDGEHVGLPEGQMGNSEVGHLNIGAGRIVYQDLAKINIACEDGSITEQKNLERSFEYSKKKNVPLHLIGLVSNGGIHSHQDHLYKLCELAKINEIQNVFVHVFTDGRDCDPKSGKYFVEKLEEKLFGAKIATICGRYYAMDRDKRWERIKEAYDAMVNGIGERTYDKLRSIQNSYDNGVTDEFIKPIISIGNDEQPIATINDGDAVICFNFRTDRCREITMALTQKNMPVFDMRKLNIHYTSMTKYDDSFNNINVIFDKKNIKNTLGEVLENNKLTQTRIAETEKYPHVTFFFSGGREEGFVGEKRLMVNSPLVATYDLQPEMSAVELSERTIQELNDNSPDFICLNFANADMVGHTGVYNAIKEAVEVVDKCTNNVVATAVKNGYTVMIIADHGNADFALNNDGTPNTAHSKNPVPCFLINSSYEEIKDGVLADVAPTILKLLALEKPNEMSGKILIK